MFRTLGHFLHWAEDAFDAAKLYFGHGTNNAWDEAVALAMFVLTLPPNADASVLERQLTLEEENRLKELVKIRIETRIPMPYLTHTAWFLGEPYYVDERVLIPRSPMAEVIEHRFEPWVQSPPHRILDLCCGSGCIGIACALTWRSVQVDAVDIDSSALSVAKINVIRHNVEDRVRLIQSDLFAGCGAFRYDIIVSNPPYVSGDELGSMPQEYSYEPRLALEAGSEGLAVVRRIIKEAPRYLTNQGILMVEVGNAAEQLNSDYPKLPFTWLEFERGGEGVFLLRKEDMV